MTEKEKMLSGMLYSPEDEELSAQRIKCSEMTLIYNSLPKNSPKQKEILKELLGKIGNSTLRAPIQFDYGCNTYIGDDSYINFGLTALDCARILIGNSVLIGPNVSLLTPMHPIHPEDRRSRLESACEIRIEDDVWIGGNVTIIGGICIGCGAVIGAGSVVTKDIPPMTVAAGNPCRILRKITEKDRLSEKSAK